MKSKSSSVGLRAHGDCSSVGLRAHGDCSSVGLRAHGDCSSVGLRAHGQSAGTPTLLGIVLAILLSLCFASAQAQTPTPINLRLLSQPLIESESESNFVQTISPTEVPKDLAALLLRAELAKSNADSIEALRWFEQAQNSPDFKDYPNKLSVWTSTGALYESVGRYTEALRQYQNVVSAVEKDTSDEAQQIQTNVLFRVGQLYSRTGNLLRSRDIFLKLVDKTSGFERTQIVQEILNLYSSGLVTGKQAKEILAKLPQSDSYMANLHARLAENAMDNGDKDLAKDEFIASLKISAGAVQESLFEKIYNLFSSAGQNDRLESTLQESFKNNPQDAQALVFMATFLELSGQPQRAMEILEANANLNSSVRQRLVHVATVLGQYEKALKIATDLVQANPSILSYHQILGDVYFHWGKRQEAVNYWTSLPAKLGNSETIYSTIASLLHERGLSDEAVALLQSARSQFGKSTSIQYEYLELLLETHHVGEAWSEYVMLQKTEPRLQAMMRYRFLTSVVQLGLVDEITPKLTALAQTNPPTQESLLARNTIENLLVNQGKYDQALKVFEGSDHRSRYEQEEIFQLAESLAQLGKSELALKAYDWIPPDSDRFSFVIMAKAKILDRLDRTDEAINLLRQVAWIPSEATAQIAQVTPSVPVPAAVTKLDHFSAEATLSLCELCVKRGQAALASNALHALGQSNWSFAPEDQARLHLCSALASSQLGSVEQATKELEIALTTGTEPVKEKAQFYLAELAFWRGNLAEAREAYQGFLTGSYGREFANEALKRLALFSQGSAKSLKDYSQADFFAWQGRTKDAISMFREVAAQAEGSDLSVYALFRAAELVETSGRKEEALQEYQRLSTMTENVTLQGEISMKLALQQPDPTVKKKALEEIILKMPDSLFADLARLEDERNLTPTAMPEAQP